MMPKSHSSLGFLCYYAEKKYIEAKKHYEKALKHKPQ
jgi:uncharacterized protein HemY